MAFNKTVHLEISLKVILLVVRSCWRYDRAWSNMCFFLYILFGASAMHDICEELTKSVCIFVFFFFLLSLKQQDKWQRACFCSFVAILMFTVTVFTQAADFMRLSFNLYSVAIGTTSDPGAHLKMARKSRRCPLPLFPLVRRLQMRARWLLPRPD